MKKVKVNFKIEMEDSVTVSVPDDYTPQMLSDTAYAAIRNSICEMESNKDLSDAIMYNGKYKIVKTEEQ